MLVLRVRLLSDYAERYLEKARKLPKETGFWASMNRLFSGNRGRKFKIFGSCGGEATEEELVSEGFAAFCEIDKRRIYFKKTSQDCEVAIKQGKEIWDMSDWGTDREFVVRFIAECYFMVTRDDFRIDDDEQKVIQALIGYIEPTREEVDEARGMVYWSLIENVIEDNEVTEDESYTMNRIREALQINEKDVFELHRKALLQRYEELRENADENEEIDLISFEKLKRMAERLGISTEIFK